MKHYSRLFALALLIAFLINPCTHAQTRDGAATVEPHHGWPDALILSNGKVEVVVVPAIGRIMQFRFSGEDGVFWENPALFGKVHEPNPRAWVNFGGDKTWPAPEAAWPKPYGGWLPPAAFDSLPVEASVDKGVVTLTSPVDPDYGIRTRRRITLDRKKPVMTVVTTYEKVAGEPQKVGVWIITQLADPLGVYVPLPPTGIFAAGYHPLGVVPPSLKNEAGLLSLARNPAGAHKIGTDANTLLWVGDKYMLRIDSPRVPGAEYPDGGSSAEVYTNPDPLKYVELEMLGPLKMLQVGQQLSQTNTYTLIRRTQKSPETEARKILGR